MSGERKAPVTQISMFISNPLHQFPLLLLLPSASLNTACLRHALKCVYLCCEVKLYYDTVTEGQPSSRGVTKCFASVCLCRGSACINNASRCIMPAQTKEQCATLDLWAKWILNATFRTIICMFDNKVVWLMLVISFFLSLSQTLIPFLKCF